MIALSCAPADNSDLADALAFALRFQGCKRVHNADEIMAEIVVKRLVEHLERAGFVVMKRPADIGAAALGRGFKNARPSRPGLAAVRKYRPFADGLANGSYPTLCCPSRSAL